MSKEELLNKVPKILRDALSSLGEESRQAILIKLLINDEASYSTLLRELDFNDSSTLNYHLKLLLESGLITKIYERREGTRDQSYYTPTEFGQNFFDKLMRVIEEPLENIYGQSDYASSFQRTQENHPNVVTHVIDAETYSAWSEGVSFVCETTNRVDINESIVVTQPSEVAVSGCVYMRTNVLAEPGKNVTGTATTTNIINVGENLVITTPEKNKNLEPIQINPLAAI